MTFTYQVAGDFPYVTPAVATVTITSGGGTVADITTNPTPGRYTVNPDT